MPELSFQSDYCDVKDALGRVMGNQKLLIRMLKMFLGSEEPQRLIIQLENHATADAADTAHAIKGIAGNLGMKPLMDISNQLMEALRHGQPHEALLPLYQETLSHTLEDTQALLSLLE